MPAPDFTPLGAYLSRSFRGITLIAESLGKSVWRGETEGGPCLVRCFASWSLKDSDQERLSLRYSQLASTPWSCLPKLFEPTACDGYLIQLEEWIEGHPWEQTVLSRESALESGRELFDLLAELAELGIVHGRISPSRLLIEESTGRLILLGLSGLPPDQELSAEKDRQDGLLCLRGLIKPEEYESLLAIRSPREISSKLSELLFQFEEAVSEPELVGRDWALRSLTRYHSLGKMVAVKAPGGGGKTHLIRSWCRHLEDRVLRGKAQNEVAPSPFQLFIEPFQELEAELKKNESLLLALRRELPVALPLLDSLQGDGGYLQHASVNWLVKLFSALHRYRPTVLILEDVHWADPFTLNFLEHWAREGEGAFVVISFRPDELTSRHPLLALAAETVDLPPLTRSQSERLLRALRPTASLTMIESALEKSAGNPFLLLQYLRSGHIQGELEKLGLSALDGSVQHSLAVASLLGVKFERELLEDCLQSAVHLEPAEELGLIGRDGDSFVFLHDRYREVCLGVLGPQELCDCHLKVAQAFVKRGDPYKVAYHFRQAARPDLGVKSALDAARRSRSRDDLNTAIFYWRTALDGIPKGDPSAVDIEYELADCYRLVGHYKESVLSFLRVLAQTEDPQFQARVLYVLGDVYFKMDELQKAREAVVEGLRLLGSGQPRWEALSFAFQALKLTVQQAFPRQGSAEHRERELLRASLFNCLAYVNWFLEGPIPSIRAHFCELAIAERYGDSAELARAQANHAIAMSALPWWPRARRYGSQAVSTAERIHDKWSQGRVRHFYGAVLLGMGQLEEAEAVLLKSVELLQQTGDRWEENGARYHLAIVYYRMGRMNEARELATVTQKIGVDIGDRLAAGDNLYTWARAQHGALPRSVLEKEKTYHSPDLQRTCELLAAEALLCLRESKPDHAVQLLERACRHYGEKMVHNLYAASLPCWLATAKRLQYQRSDRRNRRDLLAGLKSTVRVALREAGKFITNQPHAYRERGLLAILEGDTTGCLHYLNRSLKSALQQGQQQEHRLTTAALRHLSWLLGARPIEGHDSDPDCEWLLGVMESPHILDQFSLTRLLQAATAISNSLSEVTALFALCEGCVDALDQIEDCAVARHSSGQWELVAGSPRLPLDQETYREEGWQVVKVPDLESSLFLLVRLNTAKLHQKSLDLLEFLLSVTVAAADRARRTASSTLLKRDLRQSSLRLDEEARRLSLAKEQLLLGERLAITGRLATGLVHDLKNLTMSVTGTAEYLRMEKASDPPTLEAVEDILQAGKKATELLNKLSGLNRGDMVGARVIDLEQRVLETKPLLLSLCGPAVQLRFRLKPALRSELDPIQLDRILLNLVVNARDAVRFGGEVTVSLASVHLTAIQPGYPNEVPKGKYCKLSVKDDGCGIPEEVLPQIFDLHFTTKGSAGTGVGLATVLEMVETNKGYLNVKSGSQGTLFELYFPLVVSSDREAPLDTSVRTPLQPAGYRAWEEN